MINLAIEFVVVVAVLVAVCVRRMAVLCSQQGGELICLSVQMVAGVVLVFTLCKLKVLYRVHTGHHLPIAEQCDQQQMEEF